MKVIQLVEKRVFPLDVERSSLLSIKGQDYFGKLGDNDDLGTRKIFLFRYPLMNISKSREIGEVDNWQFSY